MGNFGRNWAGLMLLKWREDVWMIARVMLPCPFLYMSALVLVIGTHIYCKWRSQFYSSLNLSDPIAYHASSWAKYFLQSISQLMHKRLHPKVNMLKRLQEKSVSSHCHELISSPELWGVGNWIPVLLQGHHLYLRLAIHWRNCELWRFTVLTRVNVQGTFLYS